MKAEQGEKGQMNIGEKQGRMEQGRMDMQGRQKKTYGG